MSDPMCPAHDLPIRLVERPDPRLTKSSGTALSWRCEGGLRGHYIAHDKI